MSDEKFIQRLRQMSELAGKQASGPYTVESDTAVLLAMIQTLTAILVEDRQERAIREA